MSEYITQEEFEKYKRQQKQRRQNSLLLLVGLVIFGVLGFVLPPSVAVIAVVGMFVIVVLGIVNLINNQYFRVCPRCNGRLNSISNICTKCGANIYKVGKPSDGSEWFQ